MDQLFWSPFQLLANHIILSLMVDVPPAGGREWGSAIQHGLWYLPSNPPFLYSILHLRIEWRFWPMVHKTPWELLQKSCRLHIFFLNSCITDVYIGNDSWTQSFKLPLEKIFIFSLSLERGDPLPRVEYSAQETATWWVYCYTLRSD